MSNQVLALDVLTLETGGIVEGDWLNHDEQPLTHYRVRTTAGVTISLQLTQVRHAVRQQSAAQEYQQLLPTYRDTAEDQWKLAEWCRMQQLPAEKNVHLLRVIELEPEHAQARRALGFALVDRQWVLPAEAKRKDGFELYKGRWRTIQEIELLETAAKRELAEKEWLQKIRRWRKELDTDRAREAAEQLAQIQDPVAISPLVAVLKQDPNRRTKMLFLDVIGAIKDPTAVQALVQVSLQDIDEEIFHYCLEKIIKLNPPHIADAYIKALKDTNNIRINRAGIALGRIGDRSAIAPLIAALVTMHSQTVGPTGRGAGDTISQSFNTSSQPGVSGNSFRANEGPKTYIYRVQNQHVLDGLTKLAGGTSFGYDVRAWQYWHAQEKQVHAKAGDLNQRQE
ncbi:HEAT repeat domain-containing protein [Anatilimnocola sp. NA78]|uniref:HEAT repeat domain-containing protein n=1 Tax=Anatilimnocola sp. NA78 TaxID=3415683 RepID=UPI003CE564EC